MSLIAYDEEGERRSRGPVLVPIAPKAGPLSPEHCKILPPGIGARTTAGIPFTVTLNLCDANGRRIYSSGARVKVKAFKQLKPESNPNDPAGQDQQQQRRELVEGEVTDNNDGSYSLTISIPDGGNYSVSVEVNSIHVQDSPFSLFAISFPRSNSPFLGGPGGLGAPLAAGTRPSALPVMPVGAAAASAPAAATTTAMAAAAATTTATAAAAAAPSFDSRDLSTVLNLANISPQYDLEKLRKMFEFFGAVLECSFVGGQRQFAVVRFEKREEALNAASSLNNMLVGDRALSVQVAVSQGASATPQATSPQDEFRRAMQVAAERAKSLNASKQQQQVQHEDGAAAKGKEEAEERRREETTTASHHHRRRRRSRSRSRSRDRDGGGDSPNGRYERSRRSRSRSRERDTYRSRDYRRDYRRDRR